MTEYEKMLFEHRKRVEKALTEIQHDIEARKQNHDLDKIENPEIYEVYNEHFPILKTIPFGTKEYKQYEADYFSNAHYLHVQNRHHFYDHRNTTTKPNLLDILEALVDIRESIKQYDEYNTESAIEVLKRKKIDQLSLAEVVENTIRYLDGEREDEEKWLDNILI
ncbi:MAG: DUF5662 family protein [Mycoplasmatales bacterium]